MRGVSIVASQFVSTFTTGRSCSGVDRSRMAAMSTRSLAPSAAPCVFLDSCDHHRPLCPGVDLSSSSATSSVALTPRSPTRGMALSPGSASEAASPGSAPDRCSSPMHRTTSPGQGCKFARQKQIRIVTGLFLSNENTIGPAVDLLALVLREASRDWSLEG